MKQMVHRPLLAVAMAFGVFLVAGGALAAVKTKTIEYTDGGVTLKGMLAWDDAVSGKRPGVLLIHEWWGLNDYAMSRTKQLAAEGYVAFALDMYGGGKVTEHPKQAGEWAKQVSPHRVARAIAGLAVLKAQPQVDAANTAAIGYCFGGSTVAAMAYANADVKAVVSFHGSLPPAGEEVVSIKPRVLVQHGRDDPFIPAERITAFQAGLDRAGADWEMTIYSGTRHGFTNPDASKYGMDALAYNETADKRSWAAMLRLFDETLK